MLKESGCKRVLEYIATFIRRCIVVHPARSLIMGGVLILPHFSLSIPYEGRRCAFPPWRKGVTLIRWVGSSVRVKVPTSVVLARQSHPVLSVYTR